MVLPKTNPYKTSIHGLWFYSVGESKTGLPFENAERTMNQQFN